MTEKSQELCTIAPMKGNFLHDNGALDQPRNRTRSIWGKYNLFCLLPGQKR